VPQSAQMLLEQASLEHQSALLSGCSALASLEMALLALASLEMALSVQASPELALLEQASLEH